MSRLTALVPGLMCAAALGREWPEDLDGQVRCIDEGTRALGLAWCCPPRSHEAQDPDAVTAGLVRTPGSLPVLGLVPGPVSAGFLLSSADGSADDLRDRLDDASDAAVDRIRALSACGVRRAAVVEDTAGPLVCDDALAESHRPLLNAAAHLRMDVVLVASGLNDAASLGYDCWASDRSCSPGLSFLPKDAFESLSEMERGLDRHESVADPEEVITAPLAGSVTPELVRHAVRVLQGMATRP